MKKQEHNNKTTPTPDTTGVGQENKARSEKDLDDAVHSQTNVMPEGNNEQDADDLVHNNPAKKSTEVNEERDLDDLVHGK